MELAVVIVNYRTPQCTIECLETLARERANFPQFMAIVVENGSGDCSCETLSNAIRNNHWSDWVSILPQTFNRGFAGGSNVGIQHAISQKSPPSFILLLNNDTLVHPHCLKLAIDRMHSDPEIGAMSCMVRNADGTVQNVCRKFPRPLLETCRALGLPYLLPRHFGWADPEDPDWDRSCRARAVDWIGGAFMLVRTAVIHSAGALDESFFFYGEDTEFCHRMHKKGWLVFFDPAGEVTHLGGSSSTTCHLPARRRAELAWKGRLRVHARCYGKISALWTRFIYSTSILVNILAMWATGRRGTPPWHRSTQNLSILLAPLRQ